MPYCPQCRYEYIEGTDECPDCHILLVDKLPDLAAGDRAEHEYVELRPLPGQIYAEMVKEAFEQQGIRCMLISDVISAGLLAKGTAIPGNQVRIRVFKKDSKRAQEILYTMLDHI